MKIGDYPKWVENKIITEGDTRLIENFFGLFGEAGEVAEKIKKSLRDSTKFTNEDIAKELGDVVFYANAIANIYNLGLPMYEESKGDGNVENAMVLDTAIMLATVGKAVEGLPYFLNSSKPEEVMVKELQTILSHTILWVTQVGRHFNSDMQRIVDINVEKLDGREERGTIKGSGDDR